MDKVRDSFMAWVEMEYISVCSVVEYRVAFLKSEIEKSKDYDEIVNLVREARSIEELFQAFKRCKPEDVNHLIYKYVEYGDLLLEKCNQ